MPECLTGFVAIYLALPIQSFFDFFIPITYYAD